MLVKIMVEDSNRYSSAGGKNARILTFRFVSPVDGVSIPCASLVPISSYKSRVSSGCATLLGTRNVNSHHHECKFSLCPVIMVMNLTIY